MIPKMGCSRRGWCGRCGIGKCRIDLDETILDSDDFVDKTFVGQLCTEWSGHVYLAIKKDQRINLAISLSHRRRRGGRGGRRNLCSQAE